MDEPPLEQRILFYYDNGDDYNYTEVLNCNSYLISSSNLISSSCNQRNFIKEVIEINVKLYTTCFYNKNTKFSKGTIFINDFEFEIIDYELYYYFFVNHKRYHRIGICKVNKEAFFKIKELEKNYFEKKRLLCKLNTITPYIIDYPH